MISAICVISTGIRAEDKESFHARVSVLYDFNPVDLDEKTLIRRNNDIEDFWNYVESDKPTLLPLLRSELKENTANPVFTFDGASLLAECSSDKADLDFVIGIFAGIDWKYVDLSNLFMRTHKIAQKGIDIWPVMNRVIDTESFYAVIAGKKITLTHDYCLLYLSLVCDEKFWLDKMTTRLAAEQSPRKAKSMITAIAFSVTEKGIKAIDQAMKENQDDTVKKHARMFSVLESADSYKRPDSIKSDRNDLDSYIESIVKEDGTISKSDPVQFAKDAPFLVKKIDYAHVKDARRRTAERISNEALEEIFYFTALMQFCYTAKE